MKNKPRYSASKACFTTSLVSDKRSCAVNRYDTPEWKFYDNSTRLFLS